MRDTDLFSSIGRAVGDVESFPSFETPLLKGERNLDLESVQLSQLDKERILLSEQRDIHHFLEKTADHVFQGEFAAQTRSSEAQSDLHTREWKMRNADIALYESCMQLQSSRMEVYQANQLTDQTRREKGWLT